MARPDLRPLTPRQLCEFILDEYPTATRRVVQRLANALAAEREHSAHGALVEIAVAIAGWRTRAAGRVRQEIKRRLGD